MKQVIIAFDVDGTLISNENGLGKEHINTPVYLMLVFLSKMKNTRIIAWSGGGKEYCEQIVLKYGLNTFIERCYSKKDYDSSIEGYVDIAFDDQHDFSMADKNIIVRMK